jgi:hypothetical protein
MTGARRYGEMLRSFTARAHARESSGSPPEFVARAVRHALTARRPRIRYAVGRARLRSRSFRGSCRTIS